MKTKGIFLFILLLAIWVLCNTEILCQSFFLLQPDKQSTSLIYFFAGLLVGVLSMFVMKNSYTYELKTHNVIGPLTWLLFSGISIYFVFQIRPLIKASPIDYHYADMLPIMKYMNINFMGGKSPYSIIPEVWGGMKPIYLPTMWLPYLPAVAFNFDLRYINVILMIATFWLIIKSSYEHKMNIISILLLLPIYFLVLTFTRWDTSSFLHTEETIVIFYYTLLCYALLKRNNILIAVALCCCLLSRYSLALWCLVLVVVYFNNYKKDLFKIFTISLSLAIILILVTRGYDSISTFLSLQSAYYDKIKDDALRYDWLIKTSLGLAKFKTHNLHHLHFVFMGCAIGLPILFVAIFYKLKNKVNNNIFLIASLKICLVLFYNLLIIPYPYLFFTSGFVGLMVLSASIRERFPSR